MRNRDIVGRVTSPAGLISLTSNDVAQTVDANGMFKTSVDLGAGRTRVTMLAVDRQGKSARLEFFLEEDAATARPAVAVAPKIPSLNAGNYYALLIGNQKYQKLQRLSTPETDVSDIAPILRARYGFNIKVLLNATRYEILTELNKLRDTLTEKDNLLIYYAGHGELDRANGIANWLPIDAEPSSNANWISSSNLTEILNAMAAKHVIVVADSCYSGALTRSSIGQLETGLTDEARVQLAQADRRSPLADGADQRRAETGTGRRRRQVFGFRRDLHRHPVAEPGRARGHAAVSRNFRARAQRRAAPEIRSAAGVRRDPLRGRRLRRLPVRSEDLTVPPGA